MEREGPLLDDEQAQRLQLFLGVGDVAYCFHRMRSRENIRKFFCWLGLTAGDFVKFTAQNLMRMSDSGR